MLINWGGGTDWRKSACLTGLVIATIVLPSVAAAQNSLGIGTGEATTPSTGLFAGTMAWINAMQQDFYRSLTGALKQMREEPAQLWILIGLSFAYGVFHAAGPGHGKAVISSYMLANEVVLKRGIILSFLSAFLQGATAIIVMGLVFLLFRGTSISMGDAAGFLEVASYALIAGFGAYLLIRKLKPLFFRQVAPISLSAAGTGHNHVHDGHVHDHHAHDHHHHGDGEVCETCGHSHAPEPHMLRGEQFDWRSAWAAIAAVGIRPCSGALIVLTFAFLNQLWLGGIASVIAMSIGTAITVSVLACMAVLAKSAAMRVSGSGVMGKSVHTAIEIAGASFILVIGLVLLTAKLSV
ncbi:MAG: nickel/cobalt transporter [Rhizobiaceae bacterium]